MDYCNEIFIFTLIFHIYAPSVSTICVPCSINKFQCSYTCDCIPEESRCNGVSDCLFNDDEVTCSNCFNGGFNCQLTGLCIGSNLRCNGKADCVDGSDEENCVRCSLGSFLCNNNKCIQSDYICNELDDCGDNSDELHCSPKDVFTSKPTTEVIASSGICHCHNRVQCYSIYEYCSYGCEDGYYGDKCDNIGSGNCHCLEKWRCDTDSCSTCDHWWKGSRCSYRDYEQCHCRDKTECFSTASYSVLNTCTACEDGYTGPRCNDKSKTLSDGVLVTVIMVSLFGGMFLLCGCFAAVVKARRRKNQCRETRNQISQNSPRRLIILRGEYNRDPLRDRANEMANNHRTLRDAEGNTNGSVGDINGTSTSEIPEQDINNLHARLSVMHGLVLLARRLQQTRDEDSTPCGEVDLPPSYESVANIPSTQLPQYPDEPPPSYDSISSQSDQSTLWIRQTEGTVNTGFSSDS